MNNYPRYKSSGVEWIDDIPEHWKIRKLKHISKINGSNVDKNIYENELQVFLCNYTDVYKNDKINDKIDFTKGSCSIEEFNKFKLKKDDVIITKDSETPDDIGVPSYIDKDFDNVVCGYHLSMITTQKESLNGLFLFRQLQTKRVRNYFEINSNGITRFGLGKSPIENLDVITPPINEQQQIVQYLDTKTEIIDQLISSKEKKIELLKEQRTSLINHVITKGLNTNVKMKDSGVEWIGEIPEHWGIIKLKHVGQINSGDTITSNLIESEGLFPVYGGNGIMGYYSDFNFSHPVLSIGRVGEKCGNVHLVKEKCWINDNSLVLDISNKNTDINFIFYSLTTRDLNIIRNQNTQPLITGTMVKNEYIPNPSLQEQQQIVEHLDNQTKEIDDLVLLEQKKIDLLKEYRQSLISEVITGKIDVRTSLN